MRLADFDYPLPEAAIASHPARPRHTARLLDTTGSDFVDRRMLDLPGCLNKNDLLVVNNTQVIPARLSGIRQRQAQVSQARVEITLLRDRGANGAGCVWEVLAKPARKLALGDQLIFAEGCTAEVITSDSHGRRRLRFNKSAADFQAWLDKHGAMPLPPYIRRVEANPEDKHDYQTIFAQHKGAVAAPTAGLHFDEVLLGRLAAAGIAQTAITLHVGGGTFLPVTTDDPSQHVMHSERGHISVEAAQLINATRTNGGRIVAVGTTSLRLMESCMQAHGRIQPYRADTDLFILPGFQFRVVDMLLTNFHLPKSTLLMLVMAFAGVEKIRAAYAHALQQNYRFFSYGDGCLLARGN